MRPMPGGSSLGKSSAGSSNSSFRSLKNQGLRIEESQLESAEALIKLVAIATKAACIVIQLVQARNGGKQLPVKCAFTPEEIEALAAINKTMKGRTGFRTTRIGPTPCSGRHGSSPSSADGQATPRIGHPDQSPSTTEWLVSKSSSLAEPSKMCRNPSANAGTHTGKDSDWRRTPLQNSVLAVLAGGYGSPRSRGRQRDRPPAALQKHGVAPSFRPVRRPLFGPVKGCSCSSVG